MKSAVIWPLVIAAFVLTTPGCPTNESVRMIDDVAFLQLDGATTEMVFQIDEGPPVPVVAGDVHYKIEPGAHLLRVLLDDTLVLERQVYVSSGQVLEIRVPKS